MMYLKSHCTFLLLAFVACQAAPSPKIIEKQSISDAETKLTKDNTLTLETASEDKDRAKKSATTFCVEVRSEKDEQEPKPFILQPLPAPAPVPTSLTIVQPAPMPSPAPLTIVQPAPAPAPAPAPLTIVQPAPAPVPAPCAPERLSVNVVQPAPQPQTETVYIQQAQPAPQAPVANLVIPQPAPVPAPPQYVNIVPSAAPCAPQQPSYIVQTQAAPQPVQTLHLVQQQPQPQPQPSVTFVHQEPLKVEQEKPLQPLLHVLPESQDTLQCNCRPESHSKLRFAANSQNAGLRMIPVGPTVYPMRFNSKNPGITGREAEARHHHHKQKIYLTPLEPYSNVYNQPPLPIYYQYNSYPQSYPAVNYNTENVYSYPYDNVPSIVVNAGGPFLGQTQPRDMQAGSESQSQVASEASDLSNTQKREADPAQLKTAAQNEITQQQFEKTRTIKEAIAGAIKMTGKT